MVNDIITTLYMITVDGWAIPVFEYPTYSACAEALLKVLSDAGCASEPVKELLYYENVPQ